MKNTTRSGQNHDAVPLAREDLNQLDSGLRRNDAVLSNRQIPVYQCYLKPRVFIRHGNKFTVRPAAMLFPILFINELIFLINIGLSINFTCSPLWVLALKSIDLKLIFFTAQSRLAIMGNVMSHFVNHSAKLMSENFTHSGGIQGLGQL